MYEFSVTWYCRGFAKGWFPKGWFWRMFFWSVQKPGGYKNRRSWIPNSGKRVQKRNDGTKAGTRAHCQNRPKFGTSLAFHRGRQKVLSLEYSEKVRKGVPGANQKMRRKKSKKSKSRKRAENPEKNLKNCHFRLFCEPF